MSLTNSIGQGYLKLSNYMEKCDINNFKQNDYNFNYAIEHTGKNQIQAGKQSYKSIKKLNMLNLEQINELIDLNEKIGNPYKTTEISDEIKKCNPNSLKYIYFGLLLINEIKSKRLENFNFIEIGGGYGGQCLILLKLFELFNININNYILIDLKNIIKFQEKYLTANKRNNKCIFLSFDDYTSYKFNNNNYLFSCYSFNEVLPAVRQHYYKNLFPFINNGSFIWPTKNMDMPIEYNKTSLDIFGNFITF